MRKVFLHIGMPKTGTTALQRCFAGARPTLAANGLLYPGQDVDHAALLAVLHPARGGHFLFERRGIPADRAERDGARMMDLIRDEARRFEGDIVLSSEFLVRMDRNAIAEADRLFAEMGRQMVVVVYVRHPTGQAVSDTQQAVKRGQAFLSDLLERPRWHSLRHSVEPSAIALGEDRVIVRSFDATKARGIERDMLDALGYQGDPAEVQAVRTNESLSHPGVLLADACNRLEAERPGLRFQRDFLLRIRGPRFTLPPRVIDYVRARSRMDVAWLGQSFGLNLPEPHLPDWPGEMIPPETARDIVQEIARRQSRRGWRLNRMLRDLLERTPLLRRG